MWRRRCAAVGACTAGWQGAPRAHSPSGLQRTHSTAPACASALFSRRPLLLISLSVPGRVVCTPEGDRSCGSCRMLACTHRAHRRCRPAQTRRCRCPPAACCRRGSSAGPPRGCPGHTPARCGPEKRGRGVLRPGSAWLARPAISPRRSPQWWPPTHLAPRLPALAPALHALIIRGRVDVTIAAPADAARELRVAPGAWQELQAHGACMRVRAARARSRGGGRWLLSVGSLCAWPGGYLTQVCKRRTPACVTECECPRNWHAHAFVCATS